MSGLRLGELCAGYGGLGMAVEEVFNATTAWFSEFDDAPSKILAHHWPDVPNYGDMTKIDWSAIEPVDIISGGTPCQDLSNAGRRQGMTEGTRSNLWVQMREAIAIQKPTYVVWENVRGGLGFASDSASAAIPTPTVEDHRTWGKYARAITRWEWITSRPAPRPTEPTGRAGAERLSPKLTEWMMGLPDGWVTAQAIGISRNEQLKACGNGVVPQQAMAALRDMLAAFQSVEVAA